MRKIALGLLLGLTIVSLMACTGTGNLSPYERVIAFLEKLDQLVEAYEKPVEPEIASLPSNPDYWVDLAEFEAVRYSEHTLKEYPLQALVEPLQHVRELIRDWDTCLDLSRFDGVIRAKNTAHASTVDRCMVDFSLVILSEQGGGLLFRHQRDEQRFLIRQSYGADGALQFETASYLADDRPFWGGTYGYSEYIEGEIYQSISKTNSLVNYSYYDLVSKDSIVLRIQDGEVEWKKWYHASTSTLHSTYNGIDVWSEYYTDDSMLISIGSFTNAEGVAHTELEVDLLEVSGWDRVYLSRLPNDLVLPNALYLGGENILKQQCLAENRGCYGIYSPLDPPSLTLSIYIHDGEITDSDLNLSAFDLDLQDDRLNVEAFDLERNLFSTIELTMPDFDRLVFVSMGKRTYPGFVDRSLFW